MNEMLTPFVNYFQNPEHQPYSLSGGAPGAVLVHGFPGTPAETLPLGLTLQQLGWTVEGVLLPGLGPQIATLFERRHAEWLAAIRQVLQRVKREHSPTMLIGFSLGATLALLASAGEEPDGLVLLAPFWKVENWLWEALPILRLLFPKIYPFRLLKIDFTDPELRQRIDQFLPDVNLDEPRVQRGIRDFNIPSGIINEIRRAGCAARRAAEQVRCPAVVLQGRFDELVRPHLTRQLVTSLRGSVRYLELPGAHDLLNPERPAWGQVQAAVSDFARELVEAAGRSSPQSAVTR